MNRTVKMAFLLACALLTVTVPLFAAPDTSLRNSFELRVPTPPTPVDIAGKTLLVYELHLTNFSRDELSLTRLEVFDADNKSAVLADFRDTELATLIGRSGAPDRKQDPRRIAPGAHAVIYLWLSPGGAAKLARKLGHRIEFDDAHAQTLEHASVEGGVAEVRAPTALTLGPPLRGGPWIAIYDPAAERGHRRVLFALDGQVHLPARFAIDWIKLDASGKFAHDDEGRVANWVGYAEDVIAVADAVVTATREDVVESATLGTPRAAPGGLQNASGNYVSLDLGNGRYAFYEHLKPHSIKVKPGEHVRKGQLIGALGYTGDSTGPHLHFHVADADATLAAEGMPYVLDRFRLLGDYATLEDFGKGQPWRPAADAAGTPRTLEFPAAKSVIEFDPSRPTRQ
jgi:murein DD-endopeptidase MepM/ murein hydrolase activator NlpD